MQRGGDDGSARPQERREDVGRVKAALIERAEDRREDLLGRGAAQGAIAATDLPRDDRGTDRVLGAPVKCRPYCYAESRRPGLRWWS